MKISLITVCYNSKQTIAATVNSVLKQTHEDLEYIIIDGGSKDSTVDIIKSHESKFNGKLKWVSESDNGFYDALNKGIRMATGDIVGILNSDDFFTSSSVLSEIAGTFENTVCDAVYGDVHYVHADNPDKCVRYYSSAAFQPYMMKIGLMPAHPSFYAYKRLFDNFGYYKTGYKIAADFELLLRFIYIHKIRIKYIPLDFVTMRTGGLSTNSINSRVMIMQEHLRAFRENRIYNNCFRLSLRYPAKIMDLFKSKFRNTFLPSQ